MRNRPSASRTLAAIAALYDAADLAQRRLREEELKTRFVQVEDVLGLGPWFGGNTFGSVDAAFAPVLRYSL